MCLSHNFSGVNYGKYHELVAGRKIEDFLDKRIKEIYKKVCSKKILEKTLNEKLLGTTDRYLYPQEVKDLGFCDEIKFLN
jgi:ATP-dependent protease ClpP protease subunit